MRRAPDVRALIRCSCLSSCCFEQYYKLSDREVVYQASDSLSFRKFLGLGVRDAVPDDTTLVKFRGRLRNAQILDELFEIIAAQMTAHGLAVRDGSLRLVDATIVLAAPVAPAKDTPAEELVDPDASFTKKNGKWYYGYKLHVGQDRETGLIVGHKVTTASLHDSNVFEELLGPGAGEAMADKAYDNVRSRDHCKEGKIKDSIMHQARGKEILSEEKIANNKRISGRAGNGGRGSCHSETISALRTGCLQRAGTGFDAAKIRGYGVQSQALHSS